ERGRLIELGRTIITGELSGAHESTCTISDDGRTAVWTVRAPFAPGEEVTVVLPSSFHGKSSAGGPSYRWSFRVSAMTTPSDQIPRPPDEIRMLAAAPGISPLSRPDSTPSNLPTLKVDTASSPSSGALFLTTTNALPGIGFYDMIFDNSGAPLAYLGTAPYSCNDFRVQSNGLLSYARVTGIAGAVGIAKTTEMVIDSTLAVVDSFSCGNGYTADFHEFRLLPNGHAYLMAYDPQLIDMSSVVHGGNPNAVVYGSIIQELDAQKNVIFQWRSWDYIPITDCYDVLTASVFDYIHVNSIDVDTDGNLLVSCRETAQVLKIDHLTGDIIWKLGGKANQFSFIGEESANAPNFFSYQHDFRRIANGHVTLLDNGNQHKPPYTRAVEYALDESAMTATLVWQYRHSPDVFDPAAGSVERLPNGNTLIGWGTANFLGVGDVALTEVRPDNSTALEMSLPKGLFSYRALRYPWKSGLASASVSQLDLHPGVTYQFTSGGETTGVAITLTSGSAAYSRVTVTRYPYGPTAAQFTGKVPDLAPVRTTIAQAGFLSLSANVIFDSTFVALLQNPNQAVVYKRSNEGSGIFIPLTTSYDPSKRTISAPDTSFGEYVLGWPDGTASPSSPALISPADRSFVDETYPVVFTWSARGRASRFRVQIGTDSTFVKATIVDSTSAPTYTLPSVVHDTVYYWRVLAIGGDSSAGVYSGAWRFATRAPFATITYPNGSEVLLRDSSYVLRWLSNVKGEVRLQLLNGQSPVMVIADSAQNSGALLWTVPGTLAPGSTYRISLLSLTDTAVTSSSAQEFSIENAVLSVASTAGLPRSFALEQNFPNPFNPSTTIRYALPARASVVLVVYNMLGQQVSTLIKETQDAGLYEVRFDAATLASGMYFYRLQAGTFTETKRLLLIR
ncbi:MAG TPA: aryl-sulfate sulfotransferase, partial [Bacteroidota bacterium]|nr:aryl-sulfate sulfotransferase [Bacteroidota bacterium]